MKKLFYLMLLTFSLAHFTTFSSTWRMFFYMDASADLSDMAIKNITDMMRGNPSDNVTIVIQLHAYGSSALRYEVIGNKLQFIEEVILSGDAKADFKDAASWALGNTFADHTMIIFSNHGWGALDPHWSDEKNDWLAAEQSFSDDNSLSCSINKSRKIVHQEHKGFMFNKNSQTYLTNKDIGECLDYIHQDLLGKEIDVVAFDTCMGSMLEVATVLAPHAYYSFGVQSCALLDGFDYQAFVKILNEGLSPQETVAAFVHAFEAYYAIHDQAKIYTSSAIDLKRIDAINLVINNIVDILVEHPEYVSLLKQARKATPRFCLWPIYTDPIAFFKIFESIIKELPTCDVASDLIESMHVLYQRMDDAVVARCGGETTEGMAHGLSIYLPSHTIDRSYRISPFTEYSHWIQLLTMICAEELQD